MSNKDKKNRSAAPGAHEDVIIERKIRQTDAVHTVDEPDEVYIPDGAPEEPAETPGAKTRRFIRTGEAPFVSVRGETAENETKTAVSKYTDRFVTPEGEERVHTGFTGKMGAYDEVHAADASEGRMIDPSTFQMRFEVPEEESIENGVETRVAGRGDLLREIAGTADEDVRRNPDQLMMEGFDVVGMKTPEELKSEEELKEELDRTREKKIGDFRFWNRKENGELGETDDRKFERQPVSKALPQFLDRFSQRFSGLMTPFTPVKADEYEDHNARREGFAAIRTAKTVTLVRAGALALLGLILLIIDAVVAGNVSNNGGIMTVFGGSTAAVAVINLVFLLLGAIALAPEMKNGAYQILKLHPRTETVLLGLALATLLQNVFSIRTDLTPQADYRLLTPALLLLGAAHLVSKLFYYDSEHQCFKSVSTKSDKAYLRQVSEPVLAARLNPGDGANGKKTVYVGKTRFVSNFFARFANAQRSAEPFGRVVAICLTLSGLTAIGAWIIGRDFLYCASAAALCLSFSVPVCGLLATGFYLSRRNRALSLKSSFIGTCGEAAALTKVENVAADAAELFDGKVTSCLTSKGVTERQVRFVAAAIAKGAGGLIKKLFAADIETFDEKIPPCESLSYEEKLGLSAWVGGCKVLLGTHDLLTNHSVEVPAEEVVERVLSDGEKAIYLAIEGRFTAVFSAVYTCRDSIVKGVRGLVDAGTVLTLSTTDANITDAYAETMLSLPADSVRIMSAAAGEGLAAAAGVVTDKEDLGAAFGEGFTGLCRVADAAMMLDKVCRVSKMVCAAGAFVSLLLGMVLVFTGAYKTTGVWSVLLMQLLLTGLCFASPFFGEGVDKLKLPFAKLLQKEKPEEPAGEPLPEETETPDLDEVPDTAGTFDEPKPETPEAEGEAEETEEENEVERSFASPAPDMPAIPDPDLIPDPEPVPVENPTDATDDRAFFRFMKKEDRKPKAKAPEEKRGLIVSESMRSTFSGIGGFFSSLTEKQAPAEDGEESAETTEDILEETVRSDNAFTLYNEETRSPRGRSPEDIERAYEDVKREEQDLRSRFTAPTAPDAPVFDLDGEPEEEQPAPEDDAFTPPEDDAPVDLFDENLWSRFDDDKVFAGLKDRGEEDDEGVFEF
ncbi:MAG: hypothetical protein IK104_04250 [Clostridia bacterium]|nr:hypothetical protein [Clostridia bacterium]